MYREKGDTEYRRYAKFLIFYKGTQYTLLLIFINQKYKCMGFFLLYKAITLTSKRTKNGNWTLVATGK